MTTTNINGKWYQYSDQGQLVAANVNVYEHDDGNVTIGHTLHRRDDLDIIDDPKGLRIEGPGGWYLVPA